MIDESDNGRGLVVAVAKTIASRYGDRVVIDYPGVYGAALSVAIFRPRRAGAAEVYLTACFDWSFQIDVAGITLLEDEPYVPPECEHIARIVSIVDGIAARGFAKVRTVPFLGPLSPVRFESPGSGLLTESSAEIVKEWLPW